MDETQPNLAGIPRPLRRLLLATALLLPLLLAFWTAGVFGAAPAVSLSPIAGRVGTPVTVSGSSFAPNELGIHVHYDDVVLTSTLVANASGGWSYTFNVPNSAAGPHAVTAFGPVTTTPAQATFTVTAAISRAPVQGPVGTTVTVNGTNFASNEPSIQIKYDGNAVAGAAADPSGNWSTSFVVPSSAAGPHQIGASGPQTLAVAQVVFTVNASIAISPPGGPARTQVTVTGTNFAAGETGIKVKYDGADVAGANADGTGNWTATFGVPPSPTGPHAVGAAGPRTLGVQPQTFNVSPSINITPTSGRVGTRVRVNGEGFAANETGIKVTYATTVVANGTLAADNRGSWEALFNVPPGPRGDYIVDASGNVTAAAAVPNATFRVVPALALDPIEGPVGTGVLVTGTGFGAGETEIIVTYDGVQVAGPVAASAAGFWTAVFNVPSSSTGFHSVDAQGKVSTFAEVQGAPFTVTPSISSSPGSGPVGTVAAVEGKGFVANELGIRVLYDGTAVVTVPPAVVANARGEWAATFRVPSSVRGQHAIDAEGAITARGSVPDQSFLVTANLEIGPTVGPVGTIVTAVGTGFAADEVFSLTYDGVLVLTGTAVSVGSWSVNFGVPAGVAGPHVVDAFGTVTPATEVPNRTFTVTPNFVIQPVEGPVATTVVVTGTGFRANEPGINVTFDGNTVALTSTVPAAAVSFSQPTPPPPGTMAEVDKGVLVPVTWTSAGTPPGSQAANLTGVSIGFDISHNAAGRQQGVLNFYTILRGDLAARGATLISEYSNLFGSAASLAKNRIWWVEEDWSSAFSATEKQALLQYVQNGGCVFLNGDEHGLYVDNGGIISIFGIPYANLSGYGGLTTNITAHFVTQGVTQAYMDSPTNSLAPVAPAIDIIRDSGGRKMVAVVGIGAGRVIVFTDEFMGDWIIGSGNNRLLGNNAFDWCVAPGAAPGLQADPNGSWRGSFTVPSSRAGDHLVDAYGSATPKEQVPDRNYRVNAAITVTPNRARVGDEVTVTGANFAIAVSDTPISVTFDGNVVAVTDTLTSPGGWRLTFQVPSTSAGVHKVGARGVLTLGVAELDLTVPAAITVNPTQGPVGLVVEVRGTDFAANEANIRITFDGSTSISSTPTYITADSGGAWTALLEIPYRVGGVHQIGAFGPRTLAVPTVPFTIVAAIALDPRAAPVGAVVQIKGTGFRLFEQVVRVTVDNLTVTTTPLAIQATGIGTWVATFVVPSGFPGGAHTVAAHGNISGPVSAPFTVLPSLELNYDVGAAGSPLTASGAGFFAGEQVTVTYDANAVGTLPAHAVTGAFSFTFPVPGTPPALAGPKHVVDASQPSTPAAAVPDQIFYTTIQAAIDAAAVPPPPLSVLAAPGATLIRVGPGVYDESLLIDKPGLAIRSLGGAGATTINRSNAQGAPVVTVGPNGDDLSFHGFTITGANYTSLVQVAKEAETVRLVENVLNVATGKVGIASQDAIGLVRDVRITNSLFILADTSTAVHMTHGPAEDILISGNTFSSIVGGTGEGTVGVELAGVKDVRVTQNTLKGLSWGVRVSGDGATQVNSSNVRINGNEFRNSVTQGRASIVLRDINPAQGGAANVGAVDIWGNRLLGGGGHGVAIATLGPNVLQTINVTDNEITGYVGDGVRVALLAQGSVLRDVRIARNDIHGNAQKGVNNLSFLAGNLGSFIDARHNWWGDASGPRGGPGGGVGDAISQGVRYSAWLAKPKAFLFSGMEWRIDTSDTIFGPTIQSTVNAAAEGDELLVYPGRYPEALRVTKRLFIHSRDGAAITTIDARGVAPTAVEIGPVRPGMVFGGPNMGFTILAEQTGLVCDTCPGAMIQGHEVKIGAELGLLANTPPPPPEFGEGIIVGNSPDVHVHDNKVSVLNVVSGLGMLLYGSPNGMLLNNGVRVAGFLGESIGVVVDNSARAQLLSGVANVTSENQATGIVVVASPGIIADGPATVVAAPWWSVGVQVSGSDGASILRNKIRAEGTLRSPYSGEFSFALGMLLSENVGLKAIENEVVVRGVNERLVNVTSAGSAPVLTEAQQKVLARAQQPAQRLGEGVLSHSGSLAVGVLGGSLPGAEFVNNTMNVESHGVVTEVVPSEGTVQTHPRVDAVAYGFILDGVPRASVLWRGGRPGPDLVRAFTAGNNGGVAWGQGMDIVVNGKNLVVAGNAMKVESSLDGQGIWVLYGGEPAIFDNKFFVDAARGAGWTGMGWGADLWYSDGGSIQKNGFEVQSGNGGYGIGLLNAPWAAVEGNWINYQYGRGVVGEGAGDGIDAVASPNIRINQNKINVDGRVATRRGVGAPAPLLKFAQRAQSRQTVLNRLVDANATALVESQGFAEALSAGIWVYGSDLSHVGGNYVNVNVDGQLRLGVKQPEGGASAGCANVSLGLPTGWTSRASLPQAREGAAGVIIGDRLYVTHGYSGNDTTDLRIYDIPDNFWSSGPSAGVYRSELSGVCAVEGGQPKVFAIGGRGYDPVTGQSGVLSSVEVFDPSANSWSRRAPMPTRRAGMGVAWIRGTNTIYAIGGRDGTSPFQGNALGVNEAYNVATGTWSQRAPLPVPVMDIYSTVDFRGKIYVFGGYKGVSGESEGQYHSYLTNLVQIYDPVTNTWSQGAPMPTPRSNAIAGVCGNSIYVIGGHDYFGNLNTNEVYDPVTNTWGAAAAKPSSASEMASAHVSTGREIFAVGSGIFGSSGNANQVYTCASDQAEEAGATVVVAVGIESDLGYAPSIGFNEVNVRANGDSVIDVVGLEPPPPPAPTPPPPPPPPAPTPTPAPAPTPGPTPTAVVPPPPTPTPTAATVPTPTPVGSAPAPVAVAGGLGISIAQQIVVFEGPKATIVENNGSAEDNVRLLVRAVGGAVPPPPAPSALPLAGAPGHLRLLQAIKEAQKRRAELTGGSVQAQMDDFSELAGIGLGYGITVLDSPEATVAKNNVKQVWSNVRGQAISHDLSQGLEEAVALGLAVSQSLGVLLENSYRSVVKGNNVNVNSHAGLEIDAQGINPRQIDPVALGEVDSFVAGIILDNSGYSRVEGNNANAFGFAGGSARAFEQVRVGEAVAEMAAYHASLGMLLFESSNTAASGNKVRAAGESRADARAVESILWTLTSVAGVWAQSDVLGISSVASSDTVIEKNDVGISSEASSFGEARSFEGSFGAIGSWAGATGVFVVDQGRTRVADNTTYTRTASGWQFLFPSQNIARPGGFWQTGVETLGVWDSRVVGNNMPVPVTSLEVRPALAEIGRGATQQYQAIATLADGSVLDVTSVAGWWPASDPRVATISSSGLALGVAPGVTRVSATFRAVRATPATLVVDMASSLCAIEMKPWEAKLPAGESIQLTAVGVFNVPEKGCADKAEINPLVTWASSDTAVAIVDQKGLAKGVAPGTTTVSASRQTLRGLVSGYTKLYVFPPPAPPPAPQAQAQSTLPPAFPKEAMGILLTETYNTTVENNSVLSYGTGLHFVVSLFNGATGNKLLGNRVGASTWFAGLNHINVNDVVGNRQWGILNVTPPSLEIEQASLPNWQTLVARMPAALQALLANEPAAFYHGTPVDGTFNWYGERFGPSGRGSGAGDKVSEGVLFNPWITRNASTVITQRIGFLGLEGPGLEVGWNLISTPISLEARTLGEVIADLSKVAAAFGYDSVTRQWQALGTGSLLVPGQAIYVYASAPVRLRYLFNPLLTNPTTTRLQGGWNLVGVTPQLKQGEFWEYPEFDGGWESGVGTEGLGDHGRFFFFPSIPLTQALASLDVALNTANPGWNQVISPPVNEVTFAFTVNTPINPHQPSLRPFEGYWIQMENPDDLAGFSSTPEPLPDWLP
ncbi:MAG: IPT/TIG domain-containing protein [Chloroflexi bacterium]|nr:IPT/TIG domain-containing protein [Chloroflexota bacterium]